MRFSQESKKLQKIFNTIKGNRSALDNKKNEQTVLNFFKSTFKKQIPIQDTGWVSKAPDASDLKTIIKGDLLPETLSVNFTQSLEIPDFLLPYVDIQFLIKTPPDSILTSYEKYSTTQYDGDYIQVNGDGSNIYTGTYPLPSNNLISESDIGTKVPSANTKKVWNVTILDTDPDTGDKFTTTGELIGILTQENEETCQKETDPGPPPEFTEVAIRDTFNCRPFMSAFDDYQKITIFSSSGFTGIGELIDQSFSAGTPDCTVSSVTTTEVTATKTFGLVDNYFLYITGTRFNITQGTFEGFLGQFTGSVNGANITSFEDVTFKGYRPYYSSLTQRELNISATGDINLSNFPDTVASEVLPYSAITLSRNNGSLASILATDTVEDVLLQSFDGNFTNGNPVRKDIAFFKIQNANSFHFPYYYMKIGLGATILSPALVDDPNPSIITQNDSYTVVGTTYSLTNDTGGLVSEAFVTKGQDIQYRILITLKNPFWYQEIRKYDTSQ